MFSLWRRTRQCTWSMIPKVRTRPPGRVRLLVEMLEGRTLPSTLTVTSIADSGPGSLRAAITAANSQSGLSTIDFAIGSGPQMINLVSALPAITSPVFVDGTTQPGYSGTPLITIMGTSNGGLLTLLVGLEVASTGSTVQGLKVSGFQVGIGVPGNNNTIGGTVSGAGNFITGNNTGVAVGGNNDNINGGNNNTIGSTISGAGNVISGNNVEGVFIFGMDTVIEGNLIGTNASGTAALANGFDGVVVQNTLGTTIGGSTPGARNVISGNGRNGIVLQQIFAEPGVGAAAGNTASTKADSTVEPLFDSTVVEGNLIGTDISGTAAIPNGANGVAIELGGLAPTSSNTLATIGGSAAGAGNVISGNAAYGILLTQADNNVIEGNKIGSNAAGTGAVPNHLDGIYVSGSSNNTISGNLVSGNGRFGIFLLGQQAPQGGPVSSSNNVVQNNIIGLGAGGGILLNADDGVALFPGAVGNVIGGAGAGAGNTISANGRFGVFVNGSGTTGNWIQGNRIGTSLDGTTAAGNTLDGIALFDGATLNVIGGTVAGAGNVISGNRRDGIFMDGAGATNAVEGNLIGTSAGGSAALGNKGTGVAVAYTPNTFVGGTTSGAGNVISGNLEGVVLVGVGTTGNVVQGNFIGTDKAGSAAIANTVFGVDALGGATGNVIGGTTSGAANTIAFNGRTGVVIGSSLGDTATTGDSVLGNSIYSNAFQGIDLGNNGPTANTPGGPHSGPNHLQNSPTIQSVTASGSGTAVAVSLNSTPGHTFRIELFADANDQGQTFLGAGMLTTDSAGNGSTTITLATAFTSLSGKNVTATATDESTGDTSEFSPGTALPFMFEAPTVTTPIPNQTVAKNAAPTTIDLAAHFGDPDIVDGNTTVTLNTSSGPINLTLFDQSAPQTVANFVDYAQSGAYNNSLFHRLASLSSPNPVGPGNPAQIIQGGGFSLTANPTSITTIPTGPAIMNEFSANHPNAADTIAMARNQDPNSATDQFFINITDNLSTLGAANNGGFAVFGRFANTTTSASTLTTLSGIPTFDQTGSGASPSVRSALANLPLSNFTHGNDDPNFPGDSTAANYDLINSVTISQRDALTYSIVSNSNPGLVTASFVPNHPEQLQLSYAANQTGSATIVVKATNKNGQSVSQTFTVTVM